ncbi:MAG TPA: response regulator [Thermoanaerobaculia bacterium]|nr:response regulator [Thermoanaerobaculia bacterium]
MTSSIDVARAVPPVVLLVEDEEMLRKVVATTLRLDGFTVVEAGEGARGLEILKSDTPIDVLLTDIRMPGMNGYELATESISLRPSMPVMFMTGYAEEQMPDAIRGMAIPMIRKPFNFATLGQSIRDVIADRK